MKKLILISVGIIFFAGILVLAGTITNNSAPSSTESPYTLDDIYNRLTDEVYISSPTHNLYPSAGSDTNTMHSLSEIYDAVPAYQTIDGSTSTVQAGIYATTTLTDIAGSGLIPENIASGTTMFGVTGTYVCNPPTP